MAKADSNTTLDELLEQCTVKLNIPGKAGWGTGFFVAPGKILTCAHVVKDAGSQPVQVSWSNQPSAVEATVYGIFPDPYDIALLELKTPIVGHPCVYLDNVKSSDRAIQSGDELFTYGYPDDFSNGAPVTALCEGVTGDQPPIIKFKAGQVRPGLSGSPLLNRRTQKVCGIVKFTRDRSDDLGGGAVPVAAIFSKFNELVEQQTKFHTHDLRWSNLLPLERCRPRTIVFTSLGVAALIGLLRVFGALQGFELKAYDHLLTNRPGTELDDRIRIIAINDEDILEQEQSEEEIIGATSISNRLLTQLLQTLNDYQPRVIGLDLYREEQLLPDKYQELLNFYETHPNLITLCKVSTKPGGIDGIKAPPRAPLTQVGFSDLSVDSDNVLRRNLLAFPPDDSSPCQADTSFSFKAASHYLKQDRPDFKFDQLMTQEHCNALAFYNGTNVLFDKTFLIPSTGAYQGDPTLLEGCQILLDYRQPQHIADTYSLMSILKKEVPISELKDRIILIGVVSTKKYVDYVQTPFGVGDDQQMPGVFVQAQMVSQLLRAASGERAFISVLPLWGEGVAIFVWALVGGGIAWQVTSVQRLILVAGAAVIITYVICITSIQFNLWLPVIPLILAFLLAMGIMAWLTFNIKAGSSLGLTRASLLKQ